MSIDFQIVSAPYPTGVSWLSNCLLELNVRTRTHDAYWMPTADGSEALWPWQTLSGLVRHLPCLRRKDGFRFEPGTEVIWDHRLSFLRFPRRKTILYVRDLRDAIYSHYCRGLKKVQATADEILPFVANPRTWQQYFPGLFDLNDIDTIAYFYLIWMQAIPPDQLLILKFEDRLENPQAQLRQALTFLGIQRSDAEIQRACKASSFQSFQNNEALFLKHEHDSLTFHRAGICGEGRRYLTRDILDYFKGPAALALQNLGYEVPEDIWQPPAIALADELDTLLEQGLFIEVKNHLQERIANAETASLDLLNSQLLALLWAEAMLGLDQVLQAYTAPLVRYMCQLNANYCKWPSLQTIFTQLQKPDYYLHRVSQLPRILIFQIPDLAQTIQIACQQEAEFCLYQAPKINLSQQHIHALVNAISEQFPEPAAIVPCQNPIDSVQPIGAAIQYVEFTQIPDCILFHTKSLLGLDLAQPPEFWLPQLRIAEALDCIL